MEVSTLIVLKIILMFGFASSYQLSETFTGDVVLEEDKRGHRGGYKLPDSDVRKQLKRQPKSFVTVSSFPSSISTTYRFQMAYNCVKKSIIVVFVDGYLDDDLTHRNATNPLLRYDPEIVGKYRVLCEPNYYSFATQRQAGLMINKRFTQRSSVVMPFASQLNDVKLKGFMLDYGLWTTVKKQVHGPRHLYHLIMDKAVITFNATLKSMEDKEQPDKSLSWLYKAIDDKIAMKPLQSVRENDCVDLVKYPVIMNEQPYGVTTSLTPYRNTHLNELAKIQKTRFSFKATFYLLSWCKTNVMCSLLQHITSDDKMESPVVLINSQGQLQVQMRTTGNRSLAHITSWSVPTTTWVNLDLKISNSLINMTMSYVNKEKEDKHFLALFGAPIKYEYDDGYLLIGGSLFCKNLDAIVTRATVCRNKIMEDQAEITESDKNKWESLGSSFNKENLLKEDVIKSYFLHHNRKDSFAKICRPKFLEMIEDSNNKENRKVCELKEPPTSRNDELAKLDEIIKDLPRNLSKLGVIDSTTETMMDAFLQKMETMDHFDEFSDHINLLKQAALLGNPLAHYYLYVVFKNGVSVDIDMEKARYHLLSGARLNDRLCIKTLGYHHLMGTNGFPKSNEFAIYYYLNAAHKTQMDLMAHSEKMTSVNMVRLTDEKQMKAQLDQEADLFEWIKLQANKGVQSAQRNMARLLYWGQQGLQRNLQEAVKYYEKAAETGDPAAMYDYGVVLVKGHGTEENVDKGIEILKQAADLENPGALNTLGWYYSTKEVNYTKATEYFERSDSLGSPDAAYNLGHMFHTGKHPEGRNLRKAFLKYYRSASRGHIESCLQVAYFYNVGIKQFLPSNPNIAAKWAKFLSDKNPVMGEIIRQALQAFRKNQWAKSLFMYLSVAETGFEVASFNTAYLCQQNKDKIGSVFKDECIWRFWNESASNNRPHPYALNKMGDYHYYGESGKSPNLTMALNFYGRAASWNHSHAIFNVATMLQRHKREISDAELELTPLPVTFNSSNREELVIKLYTMCSENMKEESAIPCYLALTRLRLEILWRDTSFVAKAITFHVILLTTMFMMWLMKPRNNRNESQQPILDEVVDIEES